MKANEVRVGNVYEYLIKDDQDEPKERWELTVIDADDIKWLEKHPDDPFYRPAELTEEKLVKMGFQKHDSIIIPSFSKSISYFSSLKTLNITIQQEH